MTDAQRAHDVAEALLGDVATDAIRALLRDAFRDVRADERTAVYADITRSVRLPRSPRWEEQLCWD